MRLSFLIALVLCLSSAVSYADVFLGSPGDALVPGHHRHEEEARQLLRQVTSRLFIFNLRAFQPDE